MRDILKENKIRLLEKKIARLERSRDSLRKENNLTINEDI